jgi:hypothetical protein
MLCRLNANSCHSNNSANYTADSWKEGGREVRMRGRGGGGVSECGPSPGEAWGEGGEAYMSWKGMKNCIGYEPSVVHASNAA